MPVPELITLIAALALAFAVYAVLRHTDLGRALRATAEDAPIAAAYGMNQQALALGLAGAVRSIRRHRRRVHRALVHARAVADLRVDRRRVRDRDAGRARRAVGPLVAGFVIGVSEVAHDGGDVSRVGAAGVVLAPDLVLLLKPGANK